MKLTTILESVIPFPNQEEREQRELRKVKFDIDDFNFNPRFSVFDGDEVIFSSKNEDKANEYAYRYRKKTGSKDVKVEEM